MKIREELENSIDHNSKGENYYSPIDQFNGNQKKDLLGLVYAEKEGRERKYQMDICQIEEDEGELVKLDEYEIPEKVGKYIENMSQSKETHLGLEGGTYKDPEDQDFPRFRDVTNEDFDPEFEKILGNIKNANIQFVPFPDMVEYSDDGHPMVKKIFGATDGYKNILLDESLKHNPQDLAETLYHEEDHIENGAGEARAERNAEKRLEKYGTKINDYALKGFN